MCDTIIQVEEPENEIDLFEHYEDWPPELSAVFEKYETAAINGFDYETLFQLHKEVEAVGYTFDYYLDAIPFNLKKLNL